jgi:hypothetical protein
MTAERIVAWGVGLCLVLVLAATLRQCAPPESVPMPPPSGWSVVYETGEKGRAIGSPEALRAAVLAGHDIKVGLDAWNYAYEEVVPLESFVVTPAETVGIMIGDQSPTKPDKLTNDWRYDVTFAVSDRRESLLCYTEPLWSTFGRPDNYGYYRFWVRDDRWVEVDPDTLVRGFVAGGQDVKAVVTVGRTTFVLRGRMTFQPYGVRPYIAMPCARIVLPVPWDAEHPNPFLGRGAYRRAGFMIKSLGASEMMLEELFTAAGTPAQPAPVISELRGATVRWLVRVPVEDRP